MKREQTDPEACPIAPVANGSDEDALRSVEQGVPGAEGSSYWRDGPLHASGLADSDSASRVGATPSEMRKMYAVRAVYQRDHIAAGLLAIFLGMFGVHKFYLGYNRTAFIMMAVSIIGSIVTLGLAGAVVWLIAVIEGVIYLSKSQSEFDRIYVLNERDWF